MKLVPYDNFWVRCYKIVTILLYNTAVLFLASFGENGKEYSKRSYVIYKQDEI